MNFQNPYMAQYRPQAGGINWVQGSEGAKAYQMMPGTNAVLMDSENEGVFYIKMADAAGMCSLRTFQYKEVQPKKIDPAQYVTRDELAAVLKELKEAIGHEQPISAAQPAEQYPQYDAVRDGSQQSAAGAYADRLA